MLRKLNIRNFAIINVLEIEFSSGMTVLSGETGAGKSILIDALGLLLGDRADSDSVRHGSERADVSAQFSLDDAPEAKAWLIERELVDPDDDESCLIRRTVSADGRGRATINGSQITVRELKELGEFLLDIHGQHAHQSLLKPDIQRNLLDDFGQHTELCKQVSTICKDFQKANARLDRLENRDEDGGLRADYLKFQLQELEALNLAEDEVSALDAEHKRLANAGKLMEDSQQAINLLYEADDSSIYQALSSVSGLLQGLQQLDNSFTDINEAVANAQIQVQEASTSLRDQVERLDLDPARLDWVEKRLSAIHDLARKHQVRPEDLTEHTQNLSAELKGLESAGEEIEKLKAEINELLEQYQKAAQKLTAARNKTAETLSAQVQAIIRELGMPQGVFQIAINPIDDSKPRATGADQVEYQVTANPGQTARSLGKVASGGELSRISLAIQVIAAESTHVPSLIFDEVDTGIGGGVAEIVGRQLATLGESRQNLCVTHLPQVAAQADHHLFVGKQVIDDMTRTRIRVLSQSERIEEIARMLGGVDITAQTRAHAAEMLGLVAEAS